MDTTIIINYLFNHTEFIILFVIYILIFIKIIRNVPYKTQKKRAKAITKDAYTNPNYKFMKIPKLTKVYSVTFLCEGKKLYFYVSPQTYDRIKINSTGTLVYKGSKFYDFK